MLRGGADHHWARSQGEDSVPWSILSDGVLEPILGPPHPSWSSRAPRETGSSYRLSVSLSSSSSMCVWTTVSLTCCQSSRRSSWRCFPCRTAGRTARHPPSTRPVSLASCRLLLPPATTAARSSPARPFPSQMHFTVPLMASVRSREGPFPSWGSQDLTRVLVISHQELARTWTSLGC